MNNYIISNGKIILEDKILSGNQVVVSNGKILDVTEDSGKYDNFHKIEADGCYVSPGFIELHIHGCSDFSLESGSPDLLRGMAEFLSGKGINTFVPTVQCNETVIASLVKELEENRELSEKIPGLYVEGPFVNPEYKGGIQTKYIRTPDPEYLKRLIDISNNRIRLMTIAPETANMDEILRILYEHEIIPCFGHSGCDISILPALLPHKEYNITHLFNSMSRFSHKNSGLAMLPFLNNDVYFELNADGIHVNDESLRICREKLNSDRMILISDAVISAGDAYGDYLYYNKPVVSNESGVRYKEDNILIGSNRLISDVLKNFLKATKSSIVEAVKAATLNPCRLLGLDHIRGSIEPGKKADLILLDENLDVRKNLSG
jgi:N-acetylglucosamine-6-phosphate deacetylase